ncbi:MAG: ATP-binding protein [Gemmatimonadetes bacterium]|nr:ATP-binding protein [Gemmatimonadota bacterium]
MASPAGDACAFVLELPSDTRVIETAVAYLVDRLRAYDFAGSRLNLNFRVGVAEALANAMIYGNGSDPEKRVRVEVEVSSQAVALQVHDEGAGFDDGCVPDPTLPENLDRAGGRGIFLIRELMDEVRYEPPGNCVRMLLRREHARRHAAGN